MQHMSSELKNFPTVMVIFGATGDLMNKKIIPALFDLYEHKKLPALFSVVGVSRRSWTNEDFRVFVRDIITKFKQQPEIAELDHFVKLFSFVSGDVEKEVDYQRIAQFLGQIDGEWKVCANKLFYLAIAPEFFKTTFAHLQASKLTAPCSPEEGWTRIIVEKPFGHDLETAEHLDMLLGNMFKEVQIYRIDHYLAKEMIQNILTFRFSNNLFEANWSNETIESIDIRLWENLGVEERGSFYDGVGALRDVGQNHLLQMLAFVTMDEPDHRSPEAIREKRAELLQGLEIPTPSTIKEGTFRAQYEGYRSIKNVQPDSSTETYFKIRTKLTSPRWRGVDITLESGKRMGEQRKEIVVNFKHPSPCLCPPESKEHFKNRVIFSMEPVEGIKIEFWSKKPGLEFDTEKRSFDFLLRTGTEKKQYVEEYKKLLLECIQGDQTLFISTEEMKAMWDFVDPITKAWQTNVVPLHTYTPGSAEIALKALENNVEKVVEVKKEIGVIGLGKMGANMVRRLLEKGWKVVGYNRSKEIIDELAVFGMIPVYSVQELVQKLSPERLVWVMLPAGEVTEEMLFSEKGVVRLLQKGDTIIDGGNSFYKDTERRGRELEKIGINFFDVGTSGGPGGARHGACLMIGGEEALFKKYRSLFEDFSNGTSYQFFKGAGAGHFVKMIHNGIEYGMMQAIAEGFHILKEARFNLNLTDVTSIYNNGSVIESRLIGWLKKGLEIHGADLGDVPGKVGYTGEGEWTVKTAHEMKLQAKIIEESLKFRINSQENPDYTGKVLMTLREQFGGHKK